MIKNTKFLDFCSGIGGGRIGLENLGMNCLGFSEISKYFSALANKANLSNQDEAWLVFGVMNKEKK